MIDDLDESLREIVLRDALNGSGVEVAFDAPTKDWTARRNAPTLDLYLYDIREKLDRRDVAYERVHDESGRVTGRRPPPRRFSLSYLITAWTQRAEDEHRLLSAMLTCFLRFDALPRDRLQGGLAEQDIPLLVSIALPPPDDRSISDLWTALGGELKPSLDLVITLPFDADRTRTAERPVLEDPRLKIAVPSDAADGEAAKAFEEPMRARARRTDAGSKGVDAEPLPEEEVFAGKEPHRGRTIRIRGLKGR